MPSAYNQYL